MLEDAERAAFAAKLYQKAYQSCAARFSPIIADALSKGQPLSVWGDPNDGASIQENAFCDAVDPSKDFLLRLWQNKQGRLSAATPDGNVVSPGKMLHGSLFIMGGLDSEHRIQKALVQQGLAVEAHNVGDLMLRRQEYVVPAETSASAREASSVCALVILYNPAPDVISPISTYASTLGKTYVVDNSPTCNAALKRQIEAIPHVEYLFGNGVNHGISEPINRMARIALQEGFEWLITFDQDSIASPDMLLRMVAFAQANSDTQLRLVAPLVSTWETVDPTVPMPPVSGVGFTIQSGLMHRLDLFDESILYDERMFIDEVDNEYCVRVRAAGYDVVQLNNAVLQHQVRDATDLRDKYTPLRYYYRYRNLLYTSEHYRNTDPLYSAHCFLTLGDIERYLGSDLVEVGSKGTAMLLALLHRMRDAWPTYDEAIAELSEALQVRLP